MTNNLTDDELMTMIRAFNGIVAALTDARVTAVVSRAAEAPPADHRHIALVIFIASLMGMFDDRQNGKYAPLLKDIQSLVSERWAQLYAPRAVQNLLAEIAKDTVKNQAPPPKI